MRRFFIVSTMIFIILTIHFIGCSKKVPVVAVINNNQEISLTELQKAFGNGSIKESYKLYQIKAMLEKLDQMIENRLKIIEAKNRHYDQDSSIIAQLEDEKRQLMLGELYQIEIEDHVVSEKDVREYYARQNKKITFRKILFNITPQMSDSIKASVEAKAEEVLQMLEEGGDFVELAKKYSEDRGTAINGGLQPEQVWNRWSDPLMQAAYYMKEGELSDVIETPSALAILKVEKIEPNVLKPYKEIQNSLRSQLLSQRKSQQQDYFKKYWQNLQDSNDLVYNDSLIGYVSELFIEHLKDSDKFIQLCKEFAESNDQVNVITFKNGKLSIVELAEKLVNESPRKKNLSKSKNNLKAYITGQVLLDILYEMAKEKHLDKNKKIEKKLSDMKDQLILAKLNDVEINKKVIMNDDSLKVYYKKNLTTKFSRKERVKVQKIVLKDKETAYKVFGLAKSGSNFTSLVKKYSQDESSKKKDGFLGYFYRGAHGKMGDLAFQIKNNEIAGPIMLNNGQYVVIKRIDYKPLEPEQYNMVKQKVKNNYTQAQKEQLNSQFINTLKEKYPVKVFKENMESIVDYD